MGIVVRQSIKGTIMNYLGVLVGFITTFFIVTKYLTTEEVGLTRELVETEEQQEVRGGDRHEVACPECWLLGCIRHIKYPGGQR